jgi:tetratricopeptide (TPR) repeat protein
MGWVVAKPYLAGHATGATVQLDPRARNFLMEGERALADGNLDLSQEDFDKASALAEQDPRVLLDEARVAAAKTDVPWLKLRLLPPDAADEMRTTKAQLADRVARVRKAADDAVAAAPEDPAALRAKIDALRIVGERDAARSYVSKVIGQASQPETAYVLAALDLAEPEPLWTTVIDRLRLAAAGEGNAGRARAALVYALARSGDSAGARAELAKLDSLTRPYPLVPNLHAFVDKSPSKPSLDGGVAVAANVPHVELSALPTQQPPPATGGGAGGGEPPAAGEGPVTMMAASQAIKKGNWARARQIYETLASRNPSDSEALAGIGDCARAQGDSSGAIGAYKRALAVNPSYLPALLGVADTEWATGDRGGAQRAYKDIEDRFPEGTYPGYVKTRAGDAPAPAPTPAPTGAAATTTATATSPTAAPKPAGSADQDGL